MKPKNILQENMRRFATKNLNEQPDVNVGSSDMHTFKSALKKTYDNVWNDMASASEDLGSALERPKMEYLPVVQHAIQQFKKWTDAKKPAPLEVYMLVAEAPALLDKMQAKSKNAWEEMRSHFGGIVDAVCDQDEDEYVTSYEPNSDDLI